MWERRKNHTNQNKYDLEDNSKLRDRCKRIAQLRQKNKDKRRGRSPGNPTVSCPSDSKQFNNLVKEIEEAKKIAASDSPMWVLRTSKIRNAGRGVYLKKGIKSAAKGTLIPIAGHYYNFKQTSGWKGCYQWELPNKTYFIGICLARKGLPLGSFINRTVGRSRYNSEEYAEYRREEKVQNLTRPNAEITCKDDAVYFRLRKRVVAGEEVLTPYGSGYHIP